MMAGASEYAVPEGHLIIAQRFNFNAGSRGAARRVPKGRLSSILPIAVNPF